VALVLIFLSSVQVSAADEAFRRFLDGLWLEAKELGISRATFENAFRGVEPDLTLPDLVLPGKADVKGQAEFTKTPAEYLNTSYLAKLAEQGRAYLTQHASTLAKIEREIGVERQIVLAIWGRETAFGTHRSPHYAIRALATQAYLGRRKDLFRKELLLALKMLEDGVISQNAMKSSWAGAMGLTQFMPSDFYAVAYDLDGDGRKDIWGSIPDALASAANQLKEKGWVMGQPWGFEVRLPHTLSCLWEGPQNAKPLRQWMDLGVVRISGREVPRERYDDPAFLLTPAGAYGPAFLVFENYLVIKRYNMSDLYAVFVGNLSDRIAGGGGFETPWADIRQLPARDIAEIQKRLSALGYPMEKQDGKAGMNTRSQIGRYQMANNLPVDCWPSEALLKHMRGLAAR
jgi:lytic murein transglycosylase